MYFMGIDPGKTGALALLDEQGNPLQILDYPGSDIELAKSFEKLLRKVDKYECKAALEDVNSFQMGRTSAFTFGNNVGQWQMLLSVNHISYIYVRPQVWQKGQLRIQDGWEYKEKKNRKTKEYEKIKVINAKEASLVGARRKYPNVDLHLKLHSGRADALWIAEYCRLYYGGK